MPQFFEPNLNTLPEAQKRLWPELAAVPSSFTLYGGTALALRLGHRQSVDFFGHEAFDPDTLLGTVPFLQDAEVTQKSANTLTVRVERGKAIFVYFFGVPQLKRIGTGDRVEKNGITIASIYDIAGTKVAVVQKRAEEKDYIDIDAMIQASAIDLPQALTAGRMIYGEQFNPELTLKALCYFEDGSVCKLSRETRARLVNAVQQVDLANLPKLGRELGDRDLGESR